MQKQLTDETGNNRHGNDNYCDDCFDSATTCFWCDDLIWDWNDDKGVNLCNFCYDKFVQCDNCNNYHYVNDMIYINNKYYCESCTESTFTYCNECDSYFLNTEHICSNCGNNSNFKLHNYSYKPNPIFIGDGDIFYGFEIEVDTIDCGNKFDNVKQVYKYLNKEKCFMYVKKDGSLNTKGIEIVSHPLDYKNAKNYLRSVSKLRCIQEGGDGYGIHIHVSKNAIKDKIHLSKLLYFFAKNNKFIEFIAERKSTRYCITEKNCDIIKKVENQKLQRYDAINIVNSTTIEFRMFRTCLSKESLLKNIQFVIAIIEYTKESSLLGLNKYSFTKYVDTTKFNELKKYLKTEKNVYNNIK